MLYGFAVLYKFVESENYKFSGVSSRIAPKESLWDKFGLAGE
jgi:hypothetical protein